MTVEIYNIYENMVIDHVMDRYQGSNELDHEQLEDIICLTLNKLPAKYVRFPIDAHAALSPEEHDKRDEVIDNAVQYALDIVKFRRQSQH
ncbi:MAG: late competence development ComFB family protein [Gammaproteobacteria bacterium]|nr:late competence development ComFB family protein [Gammaproteobacteria bacterium]